MGASGPPPARPHPILGIPAQTIKLQSTLSASTAGSSLPIISPHHPICCTNGTLYFHEDNRFACDHAEVGEDDERTTHCIQASIAMLLLELARANL